MSYRISARADADLDEIWTYIARDDPRAADRMEQALHDAMELFGGCRGSATGGMTPATVIASGA